MKAALGPDRAWVVETFSSLQGEGLRLGERQIFVRLGGCNRRCDYCDEPDTLPIPSGNLRALEEVQADILRLASLRPHRSVSFTGGEPLLQAPFLAQILPWVRSRGLETTLETNGTLPGALRLLHREVDVVSMDLKLPSATGVRDWGAHRDCLEMSPQRTFAKVVVTSASSLEEVVRAAELVSAVRPTMPFFLQAATPFAGVLPPPAARLLAMHSAARERLPDVRLSRQWHPVWELP